MYCIRETLMGLVLAVSSSTLEPKMFLNLDLRDFINFEKSDEFFMPFT